MRRAWKIFREDEHGRLRFLFHGLRGSTEVPLGKWVVAEMKQGVRDGRATFRYLSGFHAFLSRKEALRWRGKFRLPRVLVEIRVRGRSWDKPSQIGKDMRLFHEIFVPANGRREQYSGV